jgi:Tol biopolymer transport system component
LREPESHFYGIAVYRPSDVEPALDRLLNARRRGRCSPADAANGLGLSRFRILVVRLTRLEQIQSLLERQGSELKRILNTQISSQDDSEMAALLLTPYSSPDENSCRNSSLMRQEKFWSDSACLPAPRHWRQPGSELVGILAKCYIRRSDVRTVGGLMDAPQREHKEPPVVHPFQLRYTENPLARSSLSGVNRCVEVVPYERARYVREWTIRIDYTDEDVDRVDPLTLRAFRVDPQARTYSLIERSAVDVERRCVYAVIESAGLYTLIGLPRDPRVLATIETITAFHVPLLDGVPDLLPRICGLILCGPEGGGPGSLCDLCLGLDLLEGGLPEARLIPIRQFRPFLERVNGKIAFVSIDNPYSTGDIYSIDPDGSNLTRLTSNQSYQGDRFRAWSPDGSQIAFTSYRNGNYQIYVATAGGANPRQITMGGLSNMHPSWSPDGRRLAFSRWESSGAGIFTIDLDGTNLTRLTTAPGYSDVSWSPDGTRIAFVDWSVGDPEAQIHLMTPDGGSRWRLPSPNQLYHTSRPKWSPDSQRIVCYGVRPFPPGTSQGGGLFIIDAASGDVQPLRTSSPLFDVTATATWSPDGTRIAFTQDDDLDGIRVYTMRADGTDIERVTTFPVTPNDIDWQRRGVAGR